jgi:serine/threonine protein phosphatase 1
MGRLLAIGDIHGCRRALDVLLAAVAPRYGDIVVPLGDLIDRGPDSKGVIERMIQLSREVDLIPIRGNHEMMMMQARESPLALTEWRGFGGDATLESYATDSLSAIPDSHWRFIESTKPFYEAANHLLVHAKAYADLWLSDDPDHTAFSEVFNCPPPGPGSRNKIMVCGHTPQRGGLPKDGGRVIYLDTAVHAGGWLTCLDPGSMEYWQANEESACRNGTLQPEPA